MKNMNPVVHFEMPATDMVRMRKFYENAFGWETKQLGEEMGEYVVVTTSETDENRMVKKPGTINGGFYKRMDRETNQHPSVVIAVPDIKEAMRKVKDAGGKVLGGKSKGEEEPDEIPGIGLWASVLDTEGNRISILQPKKDYLS